MHTFSSCLEPDLVARFADGLATGDERRRVQEHLDRCPECRALVADLARALVTGSGPASVLDLDGTAIPTIARYTIEEVLGIGALGVVYAALDPELGRRVAIKMLRSTADGVDELHTRLRREARAMAHQHHPNIVAVYDVGTVDGRVYVAMELVDGGTLRQWLALRPRGWREVLGAYVDAGRGLAAAHARGQPHGDFKPENVLVGSDGHVRISDFGLAGTPAYMAPEQLAGAPADPRGDQFSFCSALYEGLYGELPFQLSSRADRRLALGRVRVPAGRGVPRYLRSAVLRGLSIDPADRHPSMDALLDALEGRRRWLGPVIVAAGATVLAVGALLWAAGPDPVTGRVVDAAGQPVAGASVSIGPFLVGDGARASVAMPGTYTVSTGSDGRFRFERGDLGDPPIVVAEHEVLGRAHARPVGDGPVSLVLKDVGRVEGRVTVDGAPTTVQVVALERSLVNRHYLMVMSDPAGNYAFPRLAAGEYAVVATFGAAERGGESASADVTVTPGGTARADLDLQIGPILLTVSVLGEAGAAVEAAQLFLFTGTVEAKTGAEVQQQFLSRAAGGKMGYVQGGVPAAFSGVHVGPGTACVLPVAGDLADSDWFLAHVAELAVHCRPFTVADAPRAQELTVVVPPMAQPVGSR